MNHHGHTTSAGAEMTLLPLVAEPLDRPKVFTVGGSQLFGRSGAHLDDTTSHPPIIHFNQTTSTIERRGYGDHIISIGSL